MLKVTANNFNTSTMTDAARQVWLAGLGAATVTRQWAAKDAGPMFRSLVKEGEMMEGQARRVIGRQVGNSIALATAVWNTARDTALTTVSGLVGIAASTLPKRGAPAKSSAAKAVRRSSAKSVRTRKTKRSRRG